MGKQEINYTKGIYLHSICECIIKNHSAIKERKASWIIELEHKINIANKASKGFWGVTSSDSLFVTYAQSLIQLLNSNASLNDIRDLQKRIEANSRNKIAVLFLTQEAICWPSIENIYQAAQDDERFDTTLVYTPFYHGNSTSAYDNYEVYKEMGLQVLKHDEYNLAVESPDIVVILKPYDSCVPAQYRTPELEIVVERLVFISYGMETNMDFVDYNYRMYLQYRAWKIIAYGDIVKQIGTKYGYANGENIAVWGHPRADSYLDMASKRDIIPQEWNDVIKGRSTILWTPHHMVDLSENGTGTWLLWKDTMLSAILSHPEIVFIWRPHPLMMGAIVNNGLMSKKELDSFIYELTSHENIIYDTNPDYRTSFYASDAIITDATSFCVEYLYTENPILLTPRNMNALYMHEEMNDCYYVAHSSSEIREFIKMVSDKGDPLRQKRLELKQAMFHIPSGVTTSQNILNNIFSELTKEEMKIIDEV